MYETQYLDYNECKYSHSITKRNSNNSFILYYKSNNKEISEIRLNKINQNQNQAIYKHIVDIDEFGSLGSINQLWIYSSLKGLCFVSKKTYKIINTINVKEVVMDVRCISNDNSSILM